jgi:hypothetical protein
VGVGVRVRARLRVRLRASAGAGEREKGGGREALHPLHPLHPLHLPLLIFSNLNDSGNPINLATSRGLQCLDGNYSANR